jgi:hypothetical protein
MFIKVIDVVDEKRFYFAHRSVSHRSLGMYLLNFYSALEYI